MIVRSLDRSDRPALAEFRCSDGSKHQNAVETWVRRKAWGWAKASVSNEIRVLDADSVLAGLCAFEPGEDDDSWFIRVVALATPMQRYGYASMLLATCLDELQERSPEGYAYWKVDRANEPSHRLSAGVGGVQDIALPSSRLVAYYVAFR